MKPIQFPYLIELETPKKPDQNGLILGDWKPYIPRVGTAGIHPTYGEVSFTPEMIESFEKNFRNNNLGRPLWFNKNHKPGEAMLWIQDIRVNRDENNIPQSIDYLPAYTPEGYEATQKDKKLRFLSPEFYRDYNNNGPTLAGGACTNDPFCVDKFLIELESGKNMAEKVSGILENVTPPINEDGNNTLPGAPIPEIKKLSFRDPKELLETLDAISTHLSNDETFKGKIGIKLIKGLYEPVKDMIKKHIEKNQETPAEPEAVENKEEMCGGGKDKMDLEADNKETTKLPEDKEKISLENKGGNDTVAETDEKFVKLENQIQEDRKIMLELADNYKKLSLENARKTLMLEGIPKPIIDSNLKMAEDNYNLKVKLENDEKKIQEYTMLEACMQQARLYPKENKVPIIQLGDSMHSEIIDPQQQYNRMLISDAQKRADAKK